MARRLQRSLADLTARIRAHKRTEPRCERAHVFRVRQHEASPAVYNKFRRTVGHSGDDRQACGPPLDCCGAASVPPGGMYKDICRSEQRRYIIDWTKE